MMKIQGFTALLAFFAASMVHAAEHVEWVGPNSGINWTNGTAVAAAQALLRKALRPV